jgi:hypothetical protein
MKHRIGIIDVLTHFRALSDARATKYRYITLRALAFSLARTIYGQADNTCRPPPEKQDNTNAVNLIFVPLTKAYRLLV